MKISRNKLIFISITTLLCGILAGSVAIYQNNQAESSLALDILSTITSKSQEKPAAITVTVDPLQYNQTLASYLNHYNADREGQHISCQADLNSTILHCKVEFVQKSTKKTSFSASFVKEVELISQELISQQYPDLLTPHVSLLSSAASPSSPSSALISLLGLLVGFIISTFLVQTTKR